MKQSQLAINSVSTRGPLDETLEAYSAVGFKNVEFALGNIKPYLQDHSVADLARILDQHKLRCIGGFEGGLEAFSDDAQRSLNHDQLVQNARLLAELGGTCLVVGTDGPDAPGINTVKELAKAFATVAKRIKGTGVNLCIEFNWSPVVKSFRTAAEIARRSRTDSVGVLFDPAHYYCTPTKLEEITADTAPFVKHVHVDDMSDKPAEWSNCNSDRALPGEGCLDLPAIFGRLEKFGYRGYFSIEMFSERLWAMKPHRAAKLMFDSMLPLCRDGNSSKVDGGQGRSRR